jgi:RNA recognition motif-containing protein
LRLFVANIEWSVSTEELRACFERFGEVSSCAIIADKLTGRSRGIGFVSMPNDTEALLAIEQLDGFVINGRNLRVNRLWSTGSARRSQQPRRDLADPHQFLFAASGGLAASHARIIPRCSSVKPLDFGVQHAKLAFATRCGKLDRPPWITRR